MQLNRFNLNESIRANYANKTPQSLQNNNEEITETPAEKPMAKLPSTRDYLSFTGGYSLNLAETIKNLDKLAAEKNIQVYPKNIREWAGMILEEGNKAKLTLVDIHKQYYEKLKECTSLREVKKHFREFQDVLSDEDVRFSKNSFGDAVKAGELEYFDSNEDLSLQILKLYYGDGFSLNDLKKYADGRDIYYTMTKLNIPTQNSTYGNVLKLSDPEYNARLTAEMGYKHRLALDKKAQAEGEPLHIPHGPLTEQHKKHISEGLKKFYRENPDRIFEMSDKQKNFYRQNPDKAEELSRVLDIAWNIFGAENIKKSMSRFFKVKKVPLENLDKPYAMTSAQLKTMKLFWAENEWAKKSFSKNMTYAWKKIKEQNEMIFAIKNAPDRLSRRIEEMAGLEKGSLRLETNFNPFTKKSFVDERENAIYTKFANEIPKLPDVMADTYQIAIIDIAGRVGKLDLKKLPQRYTDYANLVKFMVAKNYQNGRYKVQTTQEVQQEFLMLAWHAAEMKCEHIMPIINSALDKAFDAAMEFHGISI